MQRSEYVISEEIRCRYATGFFYTEVGRQIPVNEAREACQTQNDEQSDSS